MIKPWSLFIPVIFSPGSLRNTVILPDHAYTCHIQSGKLTEYCDLAMITVYTRHIQSGKLAEYCDLAMITVYTRPVLSGKLAEYYDLAKIPACGK